MSPASSLLFTFAETVPMPDSTALALSFFEAMSKAALAAASVSLSFEVLLRISMIAAATFSASLLIGLLVSIASSSSFFNLCLALYSSLTSARGMPSASDSASADSKISTSMLSSICSTVANWSRVKSSSAFLETAFCLVFFVWRSTSTASALPSFDLLALATALGERTLTGRGKVSGLNRSAMTGAGASSSTTASSTASSLVSFLTRSASISSCEAMRTSKEALT